MNSHSAACPKRLATDSSVFCWRKSSKVAVQHCGWDRISSSLEEPGVCLFSGLGKRNLDTAFFECIQIRLRNRRIGNYAVQYRRGTDEGKAAASELTRVANCTSLLRDFEHYTIYFRFQQIRSAEAVLHIKAIHA